MDWNTLQYLKFEKERTQPSIDLIKRIDNFPKTIIDLGSGPGNSTNQLKKHFSDSKILGVDISDKMLEKARTTYPDIEFMKCVLPYDLKNYDKFDLIFSNACIHWVKEQYELIDICLEKLNDNGIFAFQIPYINEAPFYNTLYKLIDEKYQNLKNINNFYNLTIEKYYEYFPKKDVDLTIWKTNYYHEVSGIDGVIEWYKGSGLRPYLAVLDNSDEFINDLKEELKKVMTVINDKCLLLMPRLFILAKKLNKN